MKPTVARTVHYTSFGTPGGDIPVPRAAIITAVHSDEDVALAVISPTGMYFRIDVPYSPEPKAGHWNWPPREPAPAPEKREVGGVNTQYDWCNPANVSALPTSQPAAAAPCDCKAKVEEAVRSMFTDLKARGY